MVGVGGGLRRAALINRFTKLGLLSQMAERVTFVLIPPLALIFLVLGTIFLGVATPTEAAPWARSAPGDGAPAAGSNLAAAQTGDGRDDEAVVFVLFILIGSTVFSLAFQGVDGPTCGSST